MYEMEPGFSNSKPAGKAEADAEPVGEKVLDASSDGVEDKAVKPASKRVAKKS